MLQLDLLLSRTPHAPRGAPERTVVGSAGMAAKHTLQPLTHTHGPTLPKQDGAENQKGKRKETCGLR